MYYYIESKHFAGGESKLISMHHEDEVDLQANKRKIKMSVDLLFCKTGRPPPSNVARTTTLLQ